MKEKKRRKPATCSSCGRVGHRRSSKRCPNYRMNEFLDRHDGPWNDPRHGGRI